jgi:serine phosphatase RsbU (regulator of sigma subunit)
VAGSLIKTWAYFESITDACERLREINLYLWDLRHHNAGQYLELALEALIIVEGQACLDAKDITQEAGMAHLNAGNVYWTLSRYNEAEKHLKDAIQLFKQNGNYSKEAFAHAILSNVHSVKGDYNKAFTSVTYCLQLIDEKEGEEETRGLGYLSAGSFNLDLESYDEALDFFLNSYAEFAAINDKLGMARATNNAGAVLNKFGRYQEALDYCNQSLVLYRQLDHQPGQAMALRDIGSIHTSLAEYQTALEYFNKSLELREQNYLLKTSSADGIITCLIDIGHIYNLMKLPEQALPYLIKALEICQNFNVLPKLYNVHLKLYESYKLQKRYDKALEHFEQFFEVRQQVLGQETSNKIQMIQTKYALDLIEKQAKIEKANNEKLKQAYDEIKIKNKNITSSLEYARKIQQAMIPPLENLLAMFKDAFIIYKPKDIVSGDFFWITQKNGFKFIAVADCTGHGVPGAFMSLIGYSLLNQIVNEKSILEPNRILTQLNIAIFNSLSKNSDKTGDFTADGMDIALCVFDAGMRNCYFAGAKRSLYYMKDGHMNEIKGQYLSIGFDNQRIQFHQNEKISLSEIDWIYLLSDGFPDQFGGKKGKKMMMGRVKDTLTQLNDEPGEVQKNELLKLLEEWQGNYPQTDDILFIGIKP